MSVREIAAVDRLADSVENASLHGTVRGAQIHKRDSELREGVGHGWNSVVDVFGYSGSRVADKP
jgi:hypothetical protein